jgi:hypothetical protein
MVLLATGPTGSTAITQVIGLTNWSLNMESDKVDVTAFGDSNKQYVLGIRDVKGSFNGFWDTTENKPFVASANDNGTFIYLYPDSNIATSYWYGPAWLDVTIETDVNGSVDISCNFVARGNWGQSV